MPIKDTSITYPKFKTDWGQEIDTDPEYQWAMSHIHPGEPKEPLLVIEDKRIRVVVEGHWTITKVLDDLHRLGLGELLGARFRYNPQTEHSDCFQNILASRTQKNTSIEPGQMELDVVFDIRENPVASEGIENLTNGRFRPGKLLVHIQKSSQNKSATQDSDVNTVE